LQGGIHSRPGLASHALRNYNPTAGRGKKMGAIFLSHICALFQISSSFGGGEVLILIRNKFAKLFPGQNLSVFGLFATYIPF
jgi:hypothetical protein